MTAPAPKPKLWAMPRQLWQKMDPKKADSWLAAIMGILLRSVGIVLLIFAVLIIWRMLKNQGYVLESFSVPKSLEESGLSGRIAAVRMQDAILELKAEAASVKKDDLNVGNSEDNNAMNVQVMGVEISLNSIAYQLRHLIGRQQKRITGEFIQSGNQLSLLLRMSDFPNARFETTLTSGGEEQAVRQLLSEASEKVLERNDPYRLAIVYYRRSNNQQAINIVRNIIQERPQERTWAYHAWGNILRELGELEEASNKFRIATELDSNFAISYTQWAYVLVNLKKPQEAVQKFEKGLHLDPDNPDAWITLAWQYIQLGQTEKSDTAFMRSIPAAAVYGKESFAWQAWIGAKMDQQDITGAQQIAQKALASAGEDADGYVTKGMVYFLQKDTLRAYECMRKGLDLNPDNPVAANMYVRALYGNKEYNKLNTFVRNFAFPNYMRQIQWQLLNFSAMSHNHQGQHDSALAVINRAITMDTSLAVPYSTLAETYAFQGKPKLFFEKLEKSFQLGMSTRFIDINQPPYSRFKNDQRLLRLLGKYTSPNQ